VLGGAPAIVASVDRYAIAHSEALPFHVAEDVRAAVDLGLVDRACGVDVSGLRAPAADGGTRKLGLGSSAAIVVATLAARGGFDVATRAGRRALFDAALRSHKHVQLDGSGVDVAASVFGGVLACRVRSGVLSFDAVSLAAPIAVFAARTPASTKEMVARVRAFAAADPAEHRRIIGAASEAAEHAIAASNEPDLLAALRAQDLALRELAAKAEVPIFTPEFDALAEAAREDGAFFGPSGAGGGDIGIRVGSAPASPAFATVLGRVAVEPLDLTLGVPGVEPTSG
jgi:phosphomevalonate kinase